MTSTTLAVGTGLTDLLGHPFMRHALLAGVPVAALAGVVGYFMVLRSQVFTADALSHVAFAGALGALAAGLDARLGLFAATVGVALLLGLLGEGGRTDDVVIGTVFAWVLGLGVLALSIYTSHRSAGNGTAGVNVLFGSIFGLSAGQARVSAVLAVALIALAVAIARPLLFASIDPALASARGLPVRVLGVGFLVLAGATAAQTTQAVGALLLLGLLAAPAGAARRLTDRPYRGMALAAALGVVAMVGGLVASYLLPRVPPSFAILAVATALYAASFAARPARTSPSPRREPAH